MKENSCEVGKATNKTILKKGLKQKENLLLYSNQSEKQRQKKFHSQHSHSSLKKYIRKVLETCAKKFSRALDCFRIKSQRKQNSDFPIHFSVLKVN